MGRYWRSINALVLVHNTYDIGAVQVILILCTMALATVLLLAVGLLMLAGCVRIGRREERCVEALLFFSFFADRLWCRIVQ